MTMRRLLCATAAVAILAPGAALAWTKSFVVEWMEPAFLYGGPAENGAPDSKGADCPNGINPEMDWQKLLTKSYRSSEEVSEIRHPEYRAGGQQAFYRHLGFRGPNRENVYENPTAGGDPGFIEVTGKTAEGFDLDGDPKTGFTGVDGTPGVDNAYYKVSGCTWRWRAAHRKGVDSIAFNENMRMGGWSTLVVLSGDGTDPMNDADVTVGIYNTTDRMVKDAVGEIAPNYTFRIDPNPKFQSVFKAKVTNGVVETTAPTFIRTHDFTNSRTYNGLELYRGKAKWTMNPDGTMAGLIGGYRDWFAAYEVNATGMRPFGDTASTGVRENLGHVDLAAWYFSLRRNADGLPDPRTGVNRGISSAYRMHMLPAFVVTPSADQYVAKAQIFAAK